MAWIISKKLADRLGNSLFAPEQEVDCSAQKSSVSKPSAQSKLSPIVRGYYVSGKTKAHSRYSRFGIISKRLTEDLGGAMPTLSQPASPVRTSQLLIISESDSMERKAPYFTKYTESFAKLSPDGCSWKTPHCLPGLDSTLSSNTWPRQGMMRNGECWQRPPLEHPISERGSGDYFGGKLPTPPNKRLFLQRPTILQKKTRSWIRCSLWRENESRLGRVDNGVAHWMDRLKAIGNGQVPTCMAEAFLQLTRRFLA